MSLQIRVRNLPVPMASAIRERAPIAVASMNMATQAKKGVAKPVQPNDTSVRALLNPMHIKDAVKNKRDK